MRTTSDRLFVTGGVCVLIAAVLSILSAPQAVVMTLAFVGLILGFIVAPTWPWRRGR